MKILKISNFIKGWIIGNFEPSIIKTTEFEVAVKYYLKGDSEQTHHHKIATEISVINDGVFSFNSVSYTKGDIIIMEPGDPSSFACIEDGSTTVIKIPSVKNDKYLN